MIKILPILFSLIFLLKISTISPDPISKENETILASFKTGSSKELSKHFEQGVELNINGNQGEFSKNQAELVVRDFFKKYPPENFEIIHESFSGEQIKNFIGTYTSLGDSYRILIKGKIFREEFRIYSLEIMRY